MDLDGGIALNELISGMVVGFLLVVGSGTGWQWWLVEVNFWHGIDCLDVWNLLGWLDLVETFIGKEACQVGCLKLRWFKACWIGWNWIVVWFIFMDWFVYLGEWNGFDVQRKK